MRAVLQKFDKKVWSYQELRAVTKLFDADLKREEKIKAKNIRTQQAKADINTFLFLNLFIVVLGEC